MKSKGFGVVIHYSIFAKREETLSQEHIHKSSHLWEKTIWLPSKLR